MLYVHDALRGLASGQIIRTITASRQLRLVEQIGSDVG